MKFGPFRIPKDFNEVWGLIRGLGAGLSHLSFDDNFQTFTVSHTITAGGEVAFPNEFRDGRIPSEWVVVDAVGGNQITRGTSAWTPNVLTLKNQGGADATVTIRFFR